MEPIKELELVEELLKHQLSVENGQQLATQLVEIEAWGNRVSFMLYNERRTLAKMKDKFRVPKMTGITDFDRAIMLESSVADFQAKADYLAALQENIKRRVSLGQTLLKSMRTEIESGVNLNA